MNTLKVQDLCKTYVVNKRQNNVLRNVSLEVKEGEMVCVMGPSGSGKTTLLYTVSGMDNATAGRVEFFGREITSLTANEMSDLRLREMGFVFQQMYMLKNLSIYDNIIMPAYQTAEGRTKSGRQRITDRARRMMQKMGISEVAENDTTEVSGGQLQRACICRAMINKPRMIFADEPTGALNKQNSREVMEEMNRLNEEDGVTIMMVTHDMQVASRCERILYIEDGDIRAEMILGKRDQTKDKERERKLNNWLINLGW